MSILSVLLMPLWLLGVALFGSAFSWAMIAMFVARFVHQVLNFCTFGHFVRNLEIFMAPEKNEPKGFFRMIAKALLNDMENYTYFAPVVWNSMGYSLMWIGVIFLRQNEIGGFWLPIFLHLYVLGACHSIGGNEIHYVAHLQVSTRNEAHLFKYEILNQGVRFLLEPAMGWIPGFWLDHHVKIHHKESNGADDIQTISFFERNTFNFFWYVLELPIQWYFRGPHHHYIHGEKSTAIFMVFAEVCYLSVGVGLLFWDPLASFLLIWAPHITRISFFNVMNEYCQHALVDARDGKPENPSNNSFLLLKETTEGFFPIGLQKKSENWEDQWHAVHHIYPRKHMSNLRPDCEKVKCKLVFDMTYGQYRKAVIFKDLKVLAAAWRPGYHFDEQGNELKPLPGSKPVGDAALDLAGREKLLETFFHPAFPLSKCGPCLKLPGFPFFCMKQSSSPGA